MEPIYCPRCDTTKELDDDNFYRNKGRISGFETSMCKECRRMYSQGRYKAVVKAPTLDPIPEDEIPVFGSFEDKALHEKFITITTRRTSVEMPIDVAIPIKENN